jgi:two-component system, sensor histidine kinase and response regulator
MAMLGLSGHEKRKLGIFNQMNIAFGFVLGILIPGMSYLSFGGRHTLAEWCLVSLGPIVVSVVTCIVVRYRHYESARLFFFIAHPLLLVLPRFLKIDLGTDLFFICFGVLAVFFLANLNYIIFCFSLSLTCYFIAHGMGRLENDLETTNLDLFLFFRILAIFFIFYGIFLVRNENDRYEVQMLGKNAELDSRNKEISELSSLKNKLFSAIAHDLRGPLTAMHLLFRQMEKHDMPGEEIKAMLPGITADVGKTTGHIENLLNWAKNQMAAEIVRPAMVDISLLIKDVLSFLRLQIEEKNLRIECRLEEPTLVYADQEMIKLVLRNLLSNAIKFTPALGVITLDASETAFDTCISVHDTGVGISPDDLVKLTDEDLYTTPGTDHEGGTGLGLMLCREFLAKHNGRLEIFSQLGLGSTFSFTLPRGG